MVDVATSSEAGPPGSADEVPAVSLRGLSKSFGDVHAVRELDLDVRQGEFFSMLGPSGSGKTTVLRIIAGFEAPTAGTVLLGGKDVTSVAPFERDVTTVFQDYALFPHMSVLDNVAYGLRVRGMKRSERRERAAEALRTVALEGRETRRPTQLSGGQRQRVALARALVVDPQVLLLDEPLGALDLKLREQMQVELKEIQRRVGITFVFVTHDQEEALTLSDRVAVFDNGGIEQVGPAEEVYERPQTTFVAGFVGTSNIFAGSAAQRILGGGDFAVRPEKLRLGPRGRDLGTEISLPGTIAEVVYAGAVTRYYVDLDETGTRVCVAVQNQRSDHAIADVRGGPVLVGFDRANSFPISAPADQTPVAAPTKEEESA